MNYKQCGWCEASKKISEFGKHTGAKAGVSTYCKECLRTHKRFNRSVGITKQGLNMIKKNPDLAQTKLRELKYSGRLGDDHTRLIDVCETSELDELADYLYNAREAEKYYKGKRFFSEEVTLLKTIQYTFGHKAMCNLADLGLVQIPKSLLRTS